MRAIIAGGRDFKDFSFLEKKVLETFKKLKNEGYNTKRENLEVISGTAKGADILGEEFAKRYKLKIVRFPAKWDDLTAEKCRVVTKNGWTYNALAGHNRNEEMANYAKEDKELGILIAFWDGKSTGTKSMIELARGYGLKLFVYKYS